MLRGPIANIRLAQITYGLLIAVFLSGSMLLVLNSFHTIDPANSEFLGPMKEEISLDALVSGSFNSSLFLTSVLWAIVLLTITFIIIAFYIPTKSSLGLSPSLILKEDKMKRFHLPARGYTFDVNSAQIRVSRKLSSIKGLMLREMSFTLYLPKDFSDKKRIFDFLVGEKIKYTETHVLLQKTVDIRNIPLLIIRTRGILGISNINKIQFPEF